MKQYYDYFFKDKKILLNDTVSIDMDTVLGSVTAKIKVTSEQVILDLIEKGIPITRQISEVSEDKNPCSEVNCTQDKKSKRNTKLGKAIEERLKTVSGDLNYYLNRTNNANLNSVCNWMYSFAPMELYTIYAKCIAIELDKTYKSHIRNCKEVWAIEDIEGKSLQICKDTLSDKNWINFINNVPCFRNKVDLIVCKILLKDLGKHVWSNTPRSINEEN